MQAIPTIVIDPNKLFRQGLKALLAGGELDIVGEWGSAREALQGPAAQVSLVLFDPAGTGAQEEIEALRLAFSEARFVMLTGALDVQAMTSAIQAGVLARVLPSSPRWRRTLIRPGPRAPSAGLSRRARPLARSTASRSPFSTLRP